MSIRILCKELSRLSLYEAAYFERTLLIVHEIDPDIMPEQVITEKDGLKVKCQYLSYLIRYSLPLANSASGAEDGHISNYDWDWIVKHMSNSLPGFKLEGKKLNK